MAVRVVVGEDEPLVREGIVHVLEASGFAVVGVAADAPELIRKTNAHKADVVVTDIQMPPDRTDDGLRARRSRSAGPGRRRGWSCSRGSSRTATRSKRRRSGGGRRVSAQGARRRPRLVHGVGAPGRGGRRGAHRGEVAMRRGDGVGGAAAVPGSGLAGLEDRVAALAGTLAVDSPPGAGTAIRAEIPLA